MPATRFSFGLTTYFVVLEPLELLPPMLLPVEPAPAEPLPVVELGLLELEPLELLLGELLVLPLPEVAPLASSQRCFSRPVSVVQSEADVLEPADDGVLELLDGVLELDAPLEGELLEPLL